jgi:hypothetical protein
MLEQLPRLNGGEFLGLCAIGLGLVVILGGIIVAVTKVMVSHFRRTQLDEMEASLKMEMIQRGMSAGEIKQVLEAKMGGGRGSWHESFAALAQFRANNPFAKPREKQQSS